MGQIGKNKTLVKNSRVISFWVEHTMLGKFPNSRVSDLVNISNYHRNGGSQESDYIDSRQEVARYRKFSTDKKLRGENDRRWEFSLVGRPVFLFSVSCLVLPATLKSLSTGLIQPSYLINVPWHKSIIIETDIAQPYLHFNQITTLFKTSILLLVCILPISTLCLCFQMTGLLE